MNKEKIDDMDYYEKYLLNATKEERDCYIKEHPDFMKFLMDRKCFVWFVSLF